MSGEFERPGDSGASARPADIEYWQGDLRLVAFGGRDVARTLPRDEATAAVVLAALLARHLDAETWPGEYRAVVHYGATSIMTSVVVAEDDPRVAAARKLLSGLFTVVDGRTVRRDFTAQELETVRGAVIA